MATLLHSHTTSVEPSRSHSVSMFVLKEVSWSSMVVVPVIDDVTFTRNKPISTCSASTTCCNSVRFASISLCTQMDCFCVKGVRN